MATSGIDAPAVNVTVQAPHQSSPPPIRTSLPLADHHSSNAPAPPTVHHDKTMPLRLDIQVGPSSFEQAPTLTASASTTTATSNRVRPRRSMQADVSDIRDTIFDATKSKSALEREAFEEGSLLEDVDIMYVDNDKAAGTSGHDGIVPSSSTVPAAI